MSATTDLLKRERRIASGERGSIIERWRYGRDLVAERGDRKQLKHGRIAELIELARKVGVTLTETEIRRRIRCAEAYDSEAKVGRAATDFDSWWALVDAGFPPIDAVDPDLLIAEGLDSAPDSWEQMQLEIPGLKPVISVRGRKVALIKGEDGAKVADVAEYLAMCEQMHESFGKTVEQIRQSLATMRDGAEDDEANAVEAWERGTEVDDDTTGGES